MRRRTLVLTALAAPLVVPGRLATAADDQAWPVRPIRLVVSFPAGSAGDTLGRRLAERLTAVLGQPAIVENRGGAGGTLGADLVAKAPPDGYLLGLGGIAPHAIAPAVYGALPYDPVRDFSHVALLAEYPLAIAVRADGPIRSLADALEVARHGPAGLRVGTPGNGTSSHVGLEQLRRLANVDVVHVPFRGPGPAIIETLAGRIEAVVASASELQGNERLLVIGLAMPERLPGWPAVPTFREQGVDLLATVWFGLCGPAGLPAMVADRLHQAASAAPGLAGPGAAPDRGLSRTDFSAFVAAEVARWGAVVRAAGLRPD